MESIPRITQNPRILLPGSLLSSHLFSTKLRIDYVNVSISSLTLKPTHHFHLAASQKPPTGATSRMSGRLPARDIVIDFGKYKGRMLGTLPQGYIKWMSEELRHGTRKEWAKLADEVLQDPVYQDRIEWGFAENILTGESRVALGFPTKEENAVALLRDVEERFGWDREDKVGWSKVVIDFIGTSRSGRIPRKKLSPPSDTAVSGGGEEREREMTERGGGATVGGKRGERIERMRSKRENEVRRGKVEFLKKSRGNLVNEFNGGVQPEMKRLNEDDRAEEISNPFTGRGGGSVGKIVGGAQSETKRKKDEDRTAEICDRFRELRGNFVSEIGGGAQTEVKEKKDKDDGRAESEIKEKDDRSEKIHNPFPGREALKRRVMQNRLSFRKREP